VTCYATTTHKHEDSNGCATPNPEMARVQEPFEKLLVRPFTKPQVVDLPVAPLRSAAQARTVRELGGVRIGHAQIMEVGEL
jgi:hypothetical protein